jgi:hypothetical protein
MKIKYFILLTTIFFSGMFTACMDLDIPPMNILGEQDLFSSTEGMDVYLARMYSQMPFEDFKYSPNRQFFDDWLVTPGTNEGSSIGRDAGAAMTREGGERNGEYWTRAFNLLRDANILLEELPKYESNFSEESLYNHYLGEAYFARAMVFYALAKRYGGIPLVLEVLKYPENSMEALEIPRSTEEQTWDQVLSDYNMAISLLRETSPKRGYSNKLVALGFKSEAMLFAGTVAKYNSRTGFGQKTGVRVIGFDPSTVHAASVRYLRESYNASREIMKSNRFSLYKKKWSANDRTSQYQNMVDMFFDLDSPENIYIKEYQYPYSAHGYDAYSIPQQMMGPNGYSAGNCPTLDFVELFDGIGKDENGYIKVFDENGKYLLFDHPTDIFKNAEPRLRAYVIFPMDILKGEEVEIRRGIFTGDVTNGIDPLMTVNGVVDYSYANMSNRYNVMDAYTGKGKFTKKELYLCVSRSTREIVTLPNGTQMNASGNSGSFTDDHTHAMTGFCVRKFIDPNKPTSLVLEGRSEQHFILMRYGEILLNVAEAACELALAGETAPAGDNFQEIATAAIRDIRERAGADPLVGSLTLNEDGLQAIRKERRKELAFENKILWDIRRWRTQHSDKLMFGLTQEDGAYYRGLYPFYSTQADKYFFDARLEERLNRRFSFTELNYYFAIPGGQVSRSPVIDQQPGR